MDKMPEKNNTIIIEGLVKEFFLRLGVAAPSVAIQQEESNQSSQLVFLINISLEDPQMVIGRNGETLADIQRLFHLIINKKLEQKAYVRLDINEYMKKKEAHLKKVAEDCANEVAISRQSKSLPPMSPAERRIIHVTLMDRTDVLVQSEGEGQSRYVVVSPK